MKSVGLIVEYNPFHSGHIYHIEEAKKRTNAGVVVAVMSGNFVQRGMPALVDKWKRTEVALKHGVDLVIELPVELSVQSADYFARGSIALLQNLGVDTLVFGTDVKSADSFDYQKFGQEVLKRQDEIDEYFKHSQDVSQSYPTQMTAVYRHFFPEIPLDFSSPNHVLGLAYARENAKYDQPMKIVALPRKEILFRDVDGLEKTASATAIREKILSGAKDVIQDFVPRDLRDSFDMSVSWDNYFSFLKYRILSSTLEELSQIYQMNEGFEHRLLSKIQEAADFSDLVNQLKTKRYTQARIQRLLVYVLLHIKKEDIASKDEEWPIRILGFTETGRKFLNEKKREKKLTFLSKIGSEESGMELTVRADQIYQLGSAKILEQNYGRVPVFY